jgi:hypothetical protein
MRLKMVKLPERHDTAVLQPFQLRGPFKINEIEKKTKQQTTSPNSTHNGRRLTKNDIWCCGQARPSLWQPCRACHSREWLDGGSIWLSDRGFGDFQAGNQPGKNGCHQTRNNILDCGQRFLSASSLLILPQLMGRQLKAP